MTDDPAKKSRELRKAIFAAFIGSVIEWYDFFLYGIAAALVFGKLFFPNISPLAGTMAAFGTYAVGFCARPFGGWIFGHLGDKYGRKTVLVWTLSMTGGATFLIGCLPTYHSVGIIAPILLVLLRCVQGLAVGGEWGGAVLMTVEHGHQGKRGWYGSWAQAGVPVGLLLANGVFKLSSSMDAAAFLAWGWRVAFWAGIVLTIVGFIVRNHVKETPIFLESKKQPKPTGERAVSVFDRKQVKSILLIIGARMAENGCFYIFTVFILAYATAQLGMTQANILNAILLASAVQFFSIPFFGALSDRIGRRAVYLFGSVLLTLGIFPFFWILELRTNFAVWTAIAVALGVAHAAMYAPQAAFFSELFPTKIRYSGTSLGYALSSPLAGGLAPIIATYLLHVGGGKPWLVAGYIAVLGLITTVSVLFAKETNQTDLSATE